ncbi:hypothetical protein CPB83DRAFT_850968 [Crepidotus variabilis]|uniref:F-box domain-containing protein n=1 Tax=Crepidotus variabilis TaxID=179855 RepID=A0A9P6JR73_9AGAR|nr:hypothetical protein CPB83DRAFT_850968 [Crepidotus variabilis]
MYPALLIDEIFREIIRFVLDDDPQKGKTTLVSVARTCQAWTNAALDLVWERLFSLEPLLSLLIDSQKPTNRKTPVDIQTFGFYAQRVKHIHQRHTFNLAADQHALIKLFLGKETLLPKVRSVKLSAKSSPGTLLQFVASPSLHRLDLDLGFQSSSSASDDPFCDLLLHARTACPSLRHLNLRGSSSKRLNCVLSSMNDMETVTLRMGSSLRPETVVAMMTSPRLTELEIHAGHIDLEDLEECLAHLPSSTVLLSALTKLCLRAKGPTMSHLLSFIASDSFNQLQLDLDDTVAGATAWDAVFEAIPTTAAHTLTHISLEHHFELTAPSASFPSSTDASQPVDWDRPQANLSFENLAILRKFRQLQHFSCDFTVPPCLRDQDLQKVLLWWPDLTYLDIAISSGSNEKSLTTPLTITSLLLIAQLRPNLERLILPLIVDQVPVLPSGSLSGSQLRNLSIADIRTTDTQHLARYLKALFPLLKTLHGSDDDSQTWIDVRSGL